jgi:serine/threonine-protein kinase
MGMTGMLPPQFILNNRYVITRKVGHGGMAAVYDAVDTRINRRVAIKEMSDSAITNPADRQLAIMQFQQEARMLAHLEHPNLPKVSDVFSVGGKQYLVMDFVDGDTLARILEKHNGPLPEAQVMQWAAQLCDVLHYLHSQKPPIIFRDLKPSNIMIDRSGQVKLIDFGIARMFKPGKMHDTMALGTLGYAAPEQMGGTQSDVRTDIYALGVTLHELLTNHDPTSTPHSMPSIRRLNPRVSTVMENVITRALEHDPGQRWQSMAEVKASITGRLVSPRPGASPLPPVAAPGAPSLQDRVKRPTTRLLLAVTGWSNRQIALALGGLLALVVLGLWFGTPVVSKVPFIWNNIPSFALVAPLVYAAMRRHWVPSIAHILVIAIGELVIGMQLRSVHLSQTMPLALAAAILTGALIEGFVWLLPKVSGKNREEMWQRELAWLMLMTLVISVLVQSIVWGWQSVSVVWFLIFAALVGALGWFLGDLVQQFVFLRQTGLRRGLGGRGG